MKRSGVSDQSGADVIPEIMESKIAGNPSPFGGPV